MSGQNDASILLIFSYQVPCKTTRKWVLTGVRVSASSTIIVPPLLLSYHSTCWLIKQHIGTLTTKCHCYAELSLTLTHELWSSSSIDNRIQGARYLPSSPHSETLTACSFFRKGQYLAWICQYALLPRQRFCPDKFLLPSRKIEGAPIPSTGQTDSCAEGKFQDFSLFSSYESVYHFPQGEHIHQSGSTFQL